VTRITVMKKGGGDKGHPDHYDHVAMITVNVPVSETSVTFTVSIKDPDYAVNIE